MMTYTRMQLHSNTHVVMITSFLKFIICTNWHTCTLVQVTCTSLAKKPFLYGNSEDVDSISESCSDWLIHPPVYSRHHTSIDLIYPPVHSRHHTPINLIHPPVHSRRHTPINRTWNAMVRLSLNVHNNNQIVSPARFLGHFSKQN